jgi:hypothetical protein
MTRSYVLKYFEEKKVIELVRLAFRKRSIERLRGLDRSFENVYNTFADNAGHAINLAVFSGALSAAGINYGQRMARATYEELGVHRPNKRPTETQLQNILLAMNEIDPPMLVLTNRMFEFQVADALKRMIHTGGEQVVDGLEALMRGMIILAWTTFETLSEDLLNKAIAMRPTSLGLLFGRAKPRKLKPCEQMGIAGGISKESSVKGGSQRKDMSFRTVKSIRDNYWLAFSKDHKDIDKVLNHRSIDTLHAVRNILVHTGGRVDKLFLSRVQGLPEFANANRGDQVKLDFALSRWMIDPVFDRCIGLIAEVNRWTKRNP